MTNMGVINLVGNALTVFPMKFFGSWWSFRNNYHTVDQPVVCVCYMNESESCFSTQQLSTYFTCGWLPSSPVSSLLFFFFFYMDPWSLRYTRKCICAVVGTIQMQKS